MRNREKANGYVGESIVTVKRPERFVSSSYESAGCFGTAEGVLELRLCSFKRARRNGLLVCEVNALLRKRGDSYRVDGTISVVPRKRHGTPGFGSLRERLFQSMNSTQGVRARDVFRAITSSVHIATASEESSGMLLSSRAPHERFEPSERPRIATLLFTVRRARTRSNRRKATQPRHDA